MKKLGLVAALLLVLFVIPYHSADAHRSGCHRWHSCPSDTGSYICGDLGYYSECPTTPAAPTVTSKEIYEDTLIPFTTTYKDNPTLDKGTTHVLTAGTNGTLRKYYIATYSDGVYQSKAWEKDETITDPVNEVIERATNVTPKVLSATTAPQPNKDKHSSVGGVVLGAIFLASGGAWVFSKFRK